MQINCAIMFSSNEDAGSLESPEEIASAVIEAVGGDPSKDMCTVSIQAMGSAGSLAPPPGMIPPPPPPAAGPTTATPGTNGETQ